MTTKLREVPYVDLGKQHAALKERILNAVSEVLDTGQFILNIHLDRFEKALAAKMGFVHVLGLNSGTDALIYSLRALGIGEGDEVITVPNSFVSSATAVVLAGAKPTFVDVKRDYTLDPTKLKAALTKKTKAIIPVHLTGRPCDMDPIMAFAKEHHLHVIEDCAQAIGARYKGKLVGTFGIINCFSFHPLKTLNACGDGGAIVTQDEALYNFLYDYRNLGLKTRDNCIIAAPNSRLDAMQAAILQVKLEEFEKWNAIRNRNAALYRSLLNSVEEIFMPEDRPDDYSVYHTFIIQAEKRDELKEFLAENGIGTAVHYPKPIHHQDAFVSYKDESYPEVERQAKRILSLPIHQDLTEEEIHYVASKILEFYR